MAWVRCEGSRTEMLLFMMDGTKVQCSKRGKFVLQLEASTKLQKAGIGCCKAEDGGDRLILE